MFVARITLILPSGAGENTSCCSSCGTCECSGMTRRASYCAAGKFSRTFMHSLISSQPGRNTSTEPFRPLASSAAETCAATSAARATTSSSRSRLSAIPPPLPPLPPFPPPFPPPILRARRAACK